MPITNKSIGRVLDLLDQEFNKHPPPIVTLIAQHENDPFRVLIATMLSLRTKDAVTADASRRLFLVAHTPAAMRALSEERIRKLIYPVGFYKTKAKTIKTVCTLLLENYNDIVPKTIDELITLPGVGRKTANLVLIEGYKIPAMCVDTHVHRISNIWGYVKTKTPEQTEIALREKLPKKYWLTYNALLVGYGQQVCVPVSPKCSTCPVRKYCPRIGVIRSR